MKKNTSKILVILSVVTIVGFSGYAFAEWGMGYGNHGWGHHGPGWHHRGWDGTGYGYKGGLSEDEYNKLNEEQEAFYKATETLRQKIYEKELALEQELSKENPDAKRAAKLHKELSELETKLEQKQIEHRLKMRKISPHAGRGYMGRGGRMGYGPGYCWR